MAKGLGGLSLQSTFPAWGPLPRSRLLNRQVVQLASISTSPGQERTDAAKKKSAEEPAAYLFCKFDAPGFAIPNVEGAHLLDLDFDQGVGVVFLIAPLAVIRHLKT